MQPSIYYISQPTGKEKSCTFGCLHCRQIPTYNITTTHCYLFLNKFLPSVLLVVRPHSAASRVPDALLVVGALLVLLLSIRRHGVLKTLAIQRILEVSISKIHVYWNL